MIRQIIGAGILILFVIGIIAFTIYTDGLKDALITWGIVLFLATIVFTGVLLLVG